LLISTNQIREKWTVRVFPIMGYGYGPQIYPYRDRSTILIPTNEYGTLVPRTSLAFDNVLRYHQATFATNSDLHGEVITSVMHSITTPLT
jgi:hypothetical protein